MQIPRRPALADRRGSLTQTILGFGRAASPGNLTILRAEIDAGEEEAMQVFKTFDVEGIRRENHTLAPPTWVTLAQRYAEIERQRQLGLRSSSSYKCFSGCVHRTRRIEQWCETTDLTRLAKKYNPYHYTYLKIGSRFGSGIQALFGFALVLIGLNLVLALFWLVFVVLPQVLLNDHIRPYNDIQATIFSDDVDSADRPTLLYMGGYDTKYYNDDGDTVYEMDVAYLCCSVIITFGVSFWIVSSISSLMKKGHTQLGGDGVGEIIELVFNGWDMLETTRASAKNMREHVATYLKQALLQQDLVASRKQVKSQAEMRKLYLTRAVMISLSFLTLCFSLMTVALVLQPGYREDIAKWIDGTLGEILPSIIISSINMIAPVLLKLFVKLEKWSPEVELRQAIGRIFMLKMLNLIVTALQLENPDDLSVGLSSAAAAANNGSAEADMSSGEDFTSDAICRSPARPTTWRAARRAPRASRTCSSSSPTWCSSRSRRPSRRCSSTCKVKPLGYKTTIDLPKEVLELIYRQALWSARSTCCSCSRSASSATRSSTLSSTRRSATATGRPTCRSRARQSRRSSSLRCSRCSRWSSRSATRSPRMPTRSAAAPPRELLAHAVQRVDVLHREPVQLPERLRRADVRPGRRQRLQLHRVRLRHHPQPDQSSLQLLAATIATSVLSAPVLIVVGILLCIGLNFTRAKLRAVIAALKRRRRSCRRSTTTRSSCSATTASSYRRRAPGSTVYRGGGSPHVPHVAHSPLRGGASRTHDGSLLQ